MNENEQKLLDIVLKNMLSLPAYKLKNKDDKILDQYKIFIKRNQSIKKPTLEQAHKQRTNYYDTQNVSIYEISQSFNILKLFWFTFNSLHTYQILVSLTVLVFFAYVFVRINHILFSILGTIILLVFSYLLLHKAIQFFMYFSDVKKTFDKINLMLNDIKKYIPIFESSNEDENIITNKILKNLIEVDISDLDYQWKKINIFSILFAFLISLLIVYISGDDLIELIKWLANVLNFNNFKFIENLNRETFAFLILFPIGIALAKDIIVSGLQQRNKRLRQSLAIVENRLQELTSSAIQLHSTKFVQNIRKAAIYWYQKGEISMEKAAEIAGLNRRDFLELLNREKIDVFVVDFDDLDQELERG